ncbi:hypothetical protein COV19_02285 [Candidatus Woesearchaeota archaeon CG10_big_fil_rev_8_21_14_0_10_44_13]|nr:MAG: hypothetical protein COV19_02285 [Candidatus Woesearchaeota archaeon CG10_big_fil_rev_8_21_14_0_10_44_13]
MRISELANPRQVVLVSSEAEIVLLGRRMEKKDIITLAWHMPVSMEPPRYAISVGKTRFSLNLIKKSRCFAVNFMPAEKEKEVLLCGRTTGQSTDKFRESGLTEEECEKIHCPRIKEALGWLECEVVEEIDAGDHVVFIAKVVYMREKKEGKRLFHVSGDRFVRV